MSHESITGGFPELLCTNYCAGNAMILFWANLQLIERLFENYVSIFEYKFCCKSRIKLTISKVS